MNEDVKTLWVEALRSGEYQQGQSWLKRENFEGQVEHCCLGVLTELAIKSGLPLIECEDRRGFSSFRSENEVPRDTVLLDVVGEWAGLDADGLDANRLADMNDNGSPFETIADFIESRELT